jgi:hypothetical protein
VNSVQTEPSGVAPAANAFGVGIRSLKRTNGQDRHAALPVEADE